MRNKYNNLLKYIYDYSEKTQRKETVNGLFCAILEPLIQNQNAQACVLLRIFDNEQKEASLKRLAFSSVDIYNFGSCVNKPDCSIDNIWGETQFLVVLGGRYSSALVWDYSESKTSSKVCLLYNSKTILEIAKCIADNSKVDLKEILKKYVPDRRENLLMNKSIQKIAYLLNDKNEEYLVSQNEKNTLESNNDEINTAKIINDKARFIAHEIKNHLSIINLYSAITNKRCSTLKGQEYIIESIENALKNIVNATENISYLISDLRCLSSVFKQEVNLKDLIENSVQLCKQRAEKENAQIIISKIENIIVSVDKVKVECAITNIIFNALDAKAKDIEIEAKNNSIKIKNNGEEIPEEVKERIFEENFTTKEKGNGLGLAFCKKQLQLIGGDIILVSSGNKSTIFEIKF